MIVDEDGALKNSADVDNFIVYKLGVSMESNGGDEWKLNGNN